MTADASAPAHAGRHARGQRQQGAGAAARAIAAQNLKEILAGRRTAEAVLARGKQTSLSLELAYGCLRHYFSLAAQIDPLLKRPLRAKDRDLYGLLLAGAYQLQRTRIPAHAALFETVAAAEQLGKPWAKRLVNAVLRKLPAAPPPHCEHPAWLQDLLKRQYGAEAPALMLANNARAPLGLRINRRKIRPDHYCRQLDAAQISYIPCANFGLPEALILPTPQAASTLPGFAEGQLALQDVGAQLATLPLRRWLATRQRAAAGQRAATGQEKLAEREASIGKEAGASQALEAGPEAGIGRSAEIRQRALAERQPAAGLRLLDACAAPGGKLFGLLEADLGLAITALDKSAKRLAVLREMAARLGHRRFERRGEDARPWAFECREGDATTLDWWDGAPFHAVLLDAPCSGTGTLRRHPDIKVTRRMADISRHARLQGALLENLWRVLMPGGALLYCTCSLLAEENDQVLDAFIGARDDARPAPMSLPTGRAARFGWQLLPLEPATDGFYLALIEKLQ